MAGEERGGARLALASLPGAPRDPLHLLPCAIQHDGPAAVDRYFAPAVRRDPGAPEGRQASPREPGIVVLCESDFNLGEASVSFRGRSLKGKESCLPKGYIGLVLEEANLGLTSKEREVGVKSAFDSLTVWNLERAPSSSDEIVMALAWPAIAQGNLVFPIDFACLKPSEKIANGDVGNILVAKSSNFCSDPCPRYR